MGAIESSPEAFDPRQKRTDREWEELLEREQAARAAAEAALRTTAERLAGVSHELRTPLTAILLWSRILRWGSLDEKRRQEAIEIIERSAKQQSDLIDDLLDNSRKMEPSETDRRAAPAGNREGRFAPSGLLEGVGVLLIDEAPQTRNVIRWVLEQSGADVVAAGSGDEALELVAGDAGRSLHVLLCDVADDEEKPARDWQVWTQIIRRIQTRPGARAKIPAIAITACAADEDRRGALGAGFEAVALKPVEPGELVLLVAAVAKGR